MVYLKMILLLFSLTHASEINVNEHDPILEPIDIEIIQTFDEMSKTFSPEEFNELLDEFAIYYLDELEMMVEEDDPQCMVLIPEEQIQDLKEAKELKHAK